MPTNAVLLFRYWPYLSKVTEESSDLQPLMEMRPSKMRGTSNYWNLDATVASRQLVLEVVQWLFFIIILNWY